MSSWCPHNEYVSGHVNGSNHDASLELTIALADPPTYPKLHLIMIGVNLHCGDWDSTNGHWKDITYNWEIRNKTDNIPIDCGTIKPDEGLCESGGLAEHIRLMSTRCCLEKAHCETDIPPGGQCPNWIPDRFICDRLYHITKEWRGKTIEFKIWDPSETSTVHLAIQAMLVTSVYS